LNKNVAEWNTDILANNFDMGDLKEWGFEDFELGFVVPEFEPVGIDEQGRLDQKSPVTCPECGCEFVPK
jgi:hypothetical protein